MRAVTLFVLVLGLAGCATRPPEAVGYAAMGDDILVRDYWVAVDNKAAFEQFLVDILMPALEQYYPTGEQPVRLWTTTEASEEGVFQYRFVIDPADEKYPFDVETILKHIYGSDGQEYVEAFDRFVEDDEEVEFQQSQWY